MKNINEKVYVVVGRKVKTARVYDKYSTSQVFNFVLCKIEDILDLVGIRGGINK